MTGQPDPWSGWSWVCPCGYTTRRHRDIELVENMRAGHLAWHQQQRTLRERARA